jgi:tight adherence protein C
MTDYSLRGFTLADWLPPGISPNDVIAGLAALAVLVTFFAIWQALRARSPFERRLEEVAQRKQKLRQAALARRPRGARPTPIGLMQMAVTRLNLLRSQQAVEARQKLARAGFRSRDAMICYLFAQFSLPLLLGAATLAYSSALNLMPSRPGLRYALALAAAIVGFYAPPTYVRNATDKRAKRLQFALPDGLDLMIICAEAGLSLDASLVRVSRELANTWPELADELGLTAAELTYLPDRRQALDNLANRTACEGLRGVVNTLQQTAKFGTPLAQSLRVLANEMRTLRMTKAEEKAARLPALLTVPMIVFILPTLFIVLLGPAGIQLVDTFSGRAKAASNVTVNAPPAGGGGGTVTVNNDSNAGAAPQPGGSETVVMNGGAGANAEAGEAGTAGPPVRVVTANGKGATSPAKHPPVSLVPENAVVRIIDPIAVYVDARGLGFGAYPRLAVMPRAMPDEVTDTAAFERDTVAVDGRERMVLFPAVPGPNEVRLYYRPHIGAKFAVAARASVYVRPAASGARPAMELVRQAAALGAQRFEDSHRGQSVTVAGEFLGIARPGAKQVASMATALPGQPDLTKPYAVLSVGWTEPPSDWTADWPPQLVCPLSAAELPAWAAQLRPGEAVRLRGTIAAVAPKFGVVLSPCQPLR